MGRRARVDRTAEQKLEIVLEGKEEEVGLAEYRHLKEARESIARYLREYNHDRPHRGLRDRTPRETYVGFQSDLKNPALGVQF